MRKILSGGQPALRKSGLVILFDKGNGFDTARTAGLLRIRSRPGTSTTRFPRR